VRAYWFAIALWVLIGVLISTSVYITIYKEATKYAQQHCDSHHNFAWAVLEEIGGALFSTAFWTAAATLAIASFTYMLKLSTDRLSIATNETIWFTREAFIAANRPKLIVRGIVVYQPSTFESAFSGDFEGFKEGEKVNGHLFVVNIGGTSATIEFIDKMAYWTQGRLPMRRPYENRTIPIEILDPQNRPD
jgi:hypothetical protein